MNEKVEFFRHQLGDAESSSWRKVLDTLFLTLGPQVAAFESELASYLHRGREGSAPLHGVGTSCCSLGLILALASFDIGPGDEVITTPMTFVSTTNAILHLGAKPVLVDVEPTTGLIDPAKVEKAITKRTRGILPVHLYGQLADMKALRAIADAHRLFVVEDSAHGIEMERDGVRPGDLGDCAVFSFYATKNLTSGDGGAIVTRDADRAARLKRIRNHGVSKAASERHGALYTHWDMLELGWKANLTDLDAALLRPQLTQMEERRARRQMLVERYESKLAPFVGSPSENGVPWLVERRGRSTHHLFTLQTPVAKRDALLAELGKQGVGTAVNYRAIHLLSYLEKRLELPRGSFPIAEEIGDRTISLPLYPALTEAEVDTVSQRVARALEAV